MMYIQKAYYDKIVKNLIFLKREKIILVLINGKEDNKIENALLSKLQSLNTRLNQEEKILVYKYGYEPEIFDEEEFSDLDKHDHIYVKYYDKGVYHHLINIDTNKDVSIFEIERLTNEIINDIKNF